MKNFILLGPPGSGKSTQAEVLCEHFGIHHIDMGAELRAAAEEETPFAQEINNIIHNKRELVPDVIVYGVLSQALMRLVSTQGVVLDGAPRRESQIDEVLHVLKISGRELNKAIFINLPEEVSVDRISRRFKCFSCGHRFVLGVDLSDPMARCTRCGGRVGQRKDDTPEGARKRYMIFHEETLPVVEYFRKNNLLLEIDGRKTAEEISRELLPLLEA